MSTKLDPRVVRTRILIEDAFHTLYANKTMKDITVGDITAQAGVNRATFYKHFTDKFDLYDYIVKKCFEEELAKHIVDNAPLNESSFRALVFATIQFICTWQSKRHFAIEQTDLIIETRVQKTVFDRLMYWIEPNYLNGPCDAGAEVAASAVSWAVFGVGVRLAEQNTSVQVEEVADELVKMLAGGLWNSLVQIHEKRFSTG